jgi:site-specific recombinase XerD
MEEIADTETVRQAVALFEVVGMPARNLAARTRREYQNDLHDLVKVLNGRGVRAVADVTLPLEAYQAELDRHGHKPSTRNRKTHTIKTFFSFLDRQSYTISYPTA